MITTRFAAILSLYLCLAASIAACRTDNYEVEVQPDGDTMQRKVSAWGYTSKDGVRTYADFDTAPLQHLSQIYDVPMPTNLAKRHEFESEFKRRLPKDIGDGGWYLREASPMGSTNIYVEHVDGDRKISWDLDTRQVSLHRLVDVWLVWLDSEFGDDERYPPFRELVDVVVRDDLLNIATYAWGFDMFGSVGGNELSDFDEMRLGTELFFRIAIYLAERDYFDPEKLPELVQRVRTTTTEAEQSTVIWSLILQAVAAKIGAGPEAPLPWPLTEIDEDPDAFFESVERFVAESTTIKAMAEAWEKEYWDSLSPPQFASEKKRAQRLSEIVIGEPQQASTDIMEDIPDVEVPPQNFVVLREDKSLLSELFEMAFIPDFDLFDSGSTAILKIILHVPQEPLLTNGVWGTDGTVRWKEWIDADGQWADRLPDVFYAVWATPDEDFQEEHFGNIVLEREELVEYVNWYLALAPEPMQEWDAFLMELEPGKDLIAKLQSFCFSSELARCEAESVPAAPSHKEMESGGYRLNVPLRSDIADDTIREIVRALVPEPESPDE